MEEGGCMVIDFSMRHGALYIGDRFFAGEGVYVVDGMIVDR